jgi:hypothetical protein
MQWLGEVTRSIYILGVNSSFYVALNDEKTVRPPFRHVNQLLGQLNKHEATHSSVTYTSLPKPTIGATNLSVFPREPSNSTPDLDFY